MFKSTLRWVAIGGIFAIPVLVPFIISSSMFFPYITGKNFTFRIITEVVLSAWILLALLDARYRPRFSWILATLTIFVVVIGLADMFGANPFKSFWSNFERMEGYIAILHIFAYFLVAGAVLNTEKLWNAFWYTTLGASVAIAFIGLKPAFAVLPDFAAIPRIEATFGNPIYLAVYSLFHIFIALILMEKWRGTHWHQGILGLVALLHIVAMILSMTRGTVLGFLGGALVTTALIALYERKRKVLRWGSVAVLVAVVAIIGTGYAIKDTEFGKTTPVVARFTQIELDSGTVKARFMNWGTAWEGVKERPILGWGQDNFEYVFAKYFDPGMYGEEPWFDRTHNIIFDWLIAGGFLGLIAYLLIPTSFLMHLWVLDPKEKKWSFKNIFNVQGLKQIFLQRDRTFSATERALWTGLIAAYMFHNLFVFDNIISYILFTSVLAYLHFRSTEGRAPLFEDYRVAPETVTAVALPLVLVIGGVLLWYINIPGIKTSQLLIQALMPQQLPNGQTVQRAPEEVLETYRKAIAYNQLGRQEVREQLAQMTANIQRAEGVEQKIKTDFATFAIHEVETEVERNPDSARLRLFAGSLYGSFGYLDKAEETYRKVVELAPNKQAGLFQLGEVLAFVGKDDEASELFKKAYELDTRYDLAARLYAGTLIRSGKDKEAVDLLTKHFGTPYVDDERLFVEWAKAKRFDVVIAILEKRIADNPDDVQQKVSLAAAYKEAGELDRAVALLEKTKAEKPEYAEQMDTFIKELRGQ
ncbi:MAG: O-antigen ligase [Parcubacteria group bacterium GW2011_GWD2_42_14]|nr:MAG: O-antigen ligase [Parcubacteria group bacterium GW2011_GWD2_42_14]